MASLLLVIPLLLNLVFELLVFTSYLDICQSELVILLLHFHVLCLQTLDHLSLLLVKLLQSPNLVDSTRHLLLQRLVHLVLLHVLLPQLLDLTLQLLNRHCDSLAEDATLIDASRSPIL